MRNYLCRDAVVKARLRDWPQHPPGIVPDADSPLTWLRGRPTYDLGSCHPFLKLPGAAKLRTLPDGLWLNFGGTPVDPFVDILGIRCVCYLTYLGPVSRLRNRNGVCYVERRRGEAVGILVVSYPVT
jgi:hypothetical protein